MTRQRLVVDASVAAQLAASRGGLAVLGAVGLVGPPLLWSETVAAIRQAVWRRLVSDALEAAALSTFLRAPIEPARPDGLYERVWTIAQRLGWAKTYDAEYVATAALLEIPLLTRDARLRRAVGGFVEVVGPEEL